MLDKFHMVAVISNSAQFKSRYHNYKIFAESFKKHGVTIWTLELQHGARNHAVTELDGPNHLQLWNSILPGELWYKENLLNLAFSKVLEAAPDARYIGYTDADLKFEADAMDKTVEALQRWDIVQMWSQLVNYDSEGHTKGILNGFMYGKYHGTNPDPSCNYVNRIGSPGGAWAFRREILNKMGCALCGPLADFGIVGSGDLYFAHAIVGTIEKVIDRRFSENYKKWLRIYGENTAAVVKKNVGYVPTTVRHLFHGNYAKRGYDWRNKILIKHKFDPETDLTRDASGVWRLVNRTSRQWDMREDLRKYFSSRQEDQFY